MNPLILISNYHTMQLIEETIPKEVSAIITNFIIEICAATNTTLPKSRRLEMYGTKYALHQELRKVTWHVARSIDENLPYTHLVLMQSPNFYITEWSWYAQ